MRIALLALLGASLTACDDKDTAASTDDTHTEAVAWCTELDVETCQTRTDCTTISGRPIQTVGEESCVDHTAEPTALGCMSADDDCGDAETFGASPDDPGTCWWFSSTCQPTGWTACDDVGAWGECP